MDDDKLPKASRMLQPKKHSNRLTFSQKDMKKLIEEDREETELTLDYLLEQGIDIDRPKYRYQCPDTNKHPCQFVSCRYNLFLDVSEKTGSLKLNFSQVKPGDLIPSCALDLADESGLSLMLVARYTNLTRERVRQITAEALEKLKGEEEIKPY